MHAPGTVAELILVDGLSSARITCPSGLVPAPGQYVLAHDGDDHSPLATAIFLAEPRSDGLLCAPPVPPQWRPGTLLHLRGPLGRGFALPLPARRIALIACDDGPRRLLALLGAAFRQQASVTLVCDDPPDDLPLQIEVQPLRALAGVVAWADYLAFDVAREWLPELRQLLVAARWPAGGAAAQVLVRTPMPCGGLAECGVCGVRGLAGTWLACEDGPVFDLSSLDLVG